MDINNFGPINNARIELKKLNVIAGINGSGKSTSSKLLYCFLTSNSDELNYLANLSIYERFTAIVDNFSHDMEFDLETLKSIATLSDNFPELTEKEFNGELKEYMASFKKIINESQINNKENYIKKLNALESVLAVNNIEHRKFFDVSHVL